MRLPPDGVRPGNALPSVTGKSATTAKIAKASGFTVKFTAPSDGRLTIDWYATVGKKKILIGSAAETAGSAGATSVKIKLTSAGKRLLKAAKSLKVTETAGFTLAGGATTTVSRTITLKH